jgi:mono/diheme cytochrome c family protein
LLSLEVKSPVAGNDSEQKKISNLDRWWATVKNLSSANVTQYYTRMKNRGTYPSLLPCAFTLTALLVAICFLARRSSAQEMKYPTVGTVDGRAIFRGYCAPCHGLDGKGHGPAAPALKATVADLTLLTKSAKGEFPRDHVRDILEGKETPASHGSNEMPVWGPVFHQVEGDQDWGNVRIRNIVAYVETLQRK